MGDIRVTRCGDCDKYSANPSEEDFICNHCKAFSNKHVAHFNWFFIEEGKFYEMYSSDESSVSRIALQMDKTHTLRV